MRVGALEGGGCTRPVLWTVGCASPPHDSTTPVTPTLATTTPTLTLTQLTLTQLTLTQLTCTHSKALIAGDKSGGACTWKPPSPTAPNTSALSATGASTSPTTRLGGGVKTASGARRSPPAGLGSPPTGGASASTAAPSFGASSPTASRTRVWMGTRSRTGTADVAGAGGAPTAAGAAAAAAATGSAPQEERWLSEAQREMDATALVVMASGVLTRRVIGLIPRRESV